VAEKVDADSPNKGCHEEPGRAMLAKQNVL